MLLPTVRDLGTRSSTNNNSPSFDDTVVERSRSQSSVDANHQCLLSLGGWEETTTSS
jgi:hypothetical protein